jgi:N-glycosylase/DNA lyase
MHRTVFTIPLPSNFNFWRTVFSHGWCALPPFRVDKEQHAFHRLFELREGSLVACSIRESNRSLHVQCASGLPLTTRQRGEVKALVRECLRMDETFDAFYRLASKHRQYRWIPRMSAGRLLRAPTVFEDVVKMICTTNCSWALTETMVGNLTSFLGRQWSAQEFSFPTPQALAAVSEATIRKEIRAGYRSPYLLEFAERVAAGKLHVEQWRRSDLPTSELFRQVRSVKGMGEYAAGNLLKLLGRYEYLGLDSWVRGKFREIHRNGRPTKDSIIERYYAPFGEWRGLFFWLEMTKHWYKEKFPF